MSFDKFWDSITPPYIGDKLLTDYKMVAQAAYDKGYRDGRAAANKETTQRILEIMSDRNA